MLDYGVLSKKPTIELSKNGEKIKCIDLLSETYNKDLQYDHNMGDMLIVNQYYVARPDLISLAIYGTDKYADILCKINGISNPFELNEDMLLYLPPIDVIQSSTLGEKHVGSVLVNNSGYGDSNNSSINGLWHKGKYVKANSTIDSTHNKFVKLKNEDRSPSDTTVTDKNYIIDKSLGFVIY